MTNRVALGLGMLACCVVLVGSAAGFIFAIRPAGTEERVAVFQAPAPNAAAATAVPSQAPAPAAAPIASVNVPILMYHHLKDLPQDADAEYQQLAVSPQNFREQLDYLKNNGYETVTFAQLVAAFDGTVALPAKPVIITFDDGWEDIYFVAYPLLTERGMRATFFISTNWITNVEGVVSWAQIEEMSKGGMEFGSHSATHPYLTKSEPDALSWEIKASKSALEEHTGKTITALAYPFGLYDDTVIAAIKSAGYLTACTIDPGTLVQAGELLTLPRLWVYGWTELDDFAALLAPS